MEIHHSSINILFHAADSFTANEADNSSLNSSKLVTAHGIICSV